MRGREEKDEDPNYTLIRGGAYYSLRLKNETELPVYPDPKDARSSSHPKDYRKQVAVCYKARAEALQAAFEDDRVTTIPYEKRSMDFLFDSCLARGIEPAKDNRPVMMERLRSHDNDQPVVMLSMLGPIVETPRTAFYSEHIRSAMNPEGKFEHVPHCIVQTAIMFHVSSKDLFSLLHVCKYLQADALAVLQTRARLILHENATPLALSAHLYLSNISPNRYTSAIYTNGFSFSDGNPIIQAINDHGSIEGFLKYRANQKELTKCVRHEVQSLRDAAAVRHTNADQLLQRLGIPPLIVIGWLNKYHFNSTGEVFRRLAGKYDSIARRLKTYVDKGKPASLKTVEKDIVAGNLGLVSRLLTACHRQKIEAPRIVRKVIGMATVINVLMACECRLFGDDPLTDMQLDSLFSCFSTNTGAPRPPNLVCQLPNGLFQLGDHNAVYTRPNAATAIHRQELRQYEYWQHLCQDGLTFIRVA
jgi:hypothetical protein